MRAFFYFILILTNLSLFSDINYIKDKVIRDENLLYNDKVELEKYIKNFDSIIANKKSDEIESLLFCLDKFVKKNIDLAVLKSEKKIKNRKKEDIFASIFLGTSIASAGLSGLSFGCGYLNYNRYRDSVVTDDAIKYKNLTLTSDVFGAIFAATSASLFITSIYFFSTGEDRTNIVKLREAGKNLNEIYLMR